MKAPFAVFLLAICCASVFPEAGKSSLAVHSNDSDMDSHYLILDTSAIHALYMDGEFESAIEQLERASREGLLKSHTDSVFAYKHLGVMYAARYETMERGKNYMYRLLTIEPTVRILDMYASEMIYMIFRNVKAEFEIRTARPQDSLAVGTSSFRTDSIREGSPRKVRQRRVWPYWTAGALVLAGAAVTAYFLVQDDSPPAKRYDGGL